MAWRQRGCDVESRAKAALHASDWRAVIQLGTATGNATTEEASDARVRRPVAIARAALGYVADIPALHGVPATQELRIRAMLAERTGEDPEPHWRAALSPAEEEQDRISALAGLATTGATDLPGLEEFATTHPKVAAQVTALRRPSWPEGSTSPRWIGCGGPPDQALRPRPY